MLKNPTVIQEMDMKDEFRRVIKTHGFQTGVQCLFEILKTGEWLSEVLLEEKTKGTK